MYVLKDTKQWEETILMSTWATVQWTGWHRDKQATDGGLGLLKSPEARVRLSDKAGAQICG